jgi:hypothetical protein
MDAVSLIRSQTKVAHDWLEGTMADVTPEMAHALPPGVAHPIGSRYAHHAVAEDNLIAMVKGSAPLHATSWQGKTGIPDPNLAFNSPVEWARSVKLDLAALRQYSQAVYANTDAYLGNLTESNLDSEVDLSQWGMGKWQLGAYLVAFMLGHTRDMMGEISALKGAQGAKGYPF